MKKKGGTLLLAFFFQKQLMNVCVCQRVCGCVLRFTLCELQRSALTMLWVFFACMCIYLCVRATVWIMCV